MDTKKIFEAKLEIQKLLKEHPELRELQNEIDRQMKGAVTQHNRCVIITRMLKDKAKELGKALRELEEELTKFSKKAF